MSQRAKCLHTAERVPNWSGVLICPDCRKDWWRRNYRKHYVRHMLTQVRIRAKRDGIPFELTEEDIDIPARCPVLGLALEISTGRGPADASPSIDKFVPELGYVRGNIAIISNRANRLKSDGTRDEHAALVRWMDSVQQVKNTLV